MLQKLREKIAAMRRRAELRALLTDAGYYVSVIHDAEKRLAENRRRQQELIAEERGELPNVPANEWREVTIGASSMPRAGVYSVERFVRQHGGQEIEVGEVSDAVIYGTAVFDGERRPFKIEPSATWKTPVEGEPTIFHGYGSKGCPA